MNLANVLALCLCAAAIAIGQIFFKLSSRSINITGDIFRIFLSPYFIFGGLIYAAATLLWIWLLSKIELSRAYPFMALSFIFVPLLSIFIFGESTDWKYWLGLALILGGLIVISSGDLRL